MTENENSERLNQKKTLPPAIKSDPERDAFRSKIIELIQKGDLLVQQIDDSINDQELREILDMEATYSLMVKNGLDLQEIRAKLLGNRLTESTGLLALDQHDFESVMWRLRQSAFTETKDSIGLLIDNPYCIYFWVYFHRKPRIRCALHQRIKDVFIPLQPCLDTSEVHLYSAKYFVRCNPSEYDEAFHLCGENNQTGKFAMLKEDGIPIRINSEKRKHIVIRVYNDVADFLASSSKTPRQDFIHKVKDMKDWESLDVPAKRGLFGSKSNRDSNFPYFECLLQFCFSNVGRRVPLSVCCDVIGRMLLMQMKRGMVNESLAMITEKVTAQKKWICSFNDQNDRTWVSLIKFMFHLYWIPFIVQMESAKPFDHNMMRIDILQQLIRGEYGPPKRIICVLRTVNQPVAKRFIKALIRVIDNMKDSLWRNRYLLWYNVINSICFNGKYLTKPTVKRNINDCNFEVVFIRMIQIDVSIHLITGANRIRPLENEGFWILSTSMRDADHVVKFGIYNKMCCILSVFRSIGLSEVILEYKSEIHLILSGQKGPLEAAIGLYYLLQPQTTQDINALIDLVAEYVLDLHPSMDKSDASAFRKLVRLMTTNKQIGDNAALIESISQNRSIYWREEMIPTLARPVHKINTEQNILLREAIFNKFWLNYGLLKLVKFLIGEHGLSIGTFNNMIEKHPERIQNERFDHWLRVIVDNNVKQTIKLRIVEHPPTTYRRCLAEEYAEIDELLDVLEETLLTAPYDAKSAKSHKSLISNDMEDVCNVIMESFLAVETIYYDCHDAAIDNLQMINYFHCGYGMYCVEYCHRLMQHAKGVEITYCKTLIDNYIVWWRSVKYQFAEAQLEQRIVDFLMGPGDVYDSLHKMYDKVGGPLDPDLHLKAEEKITKYTISPETVMRNSEMFLTHFAPSDASMWDESIEQLNLGMQAVSRLLSYGLDVKTVMKMDWTWYAPHRHFFEDLMKDSESGIFKNLWNDSIETATERWSNHKGLCYEDLDVVDMCLWLESRDWEPNQLPVVYQLQDIFIKKKITGSVLNQATQLGDDSIEINQVALFTSKSGIDDQRFHDVLRLLFSGMAQRPTFEWKHQYSMSMLKVIHYVRIKPSWNLFRHHLKQRECRVYDIQRHFQFDSAWNIEMSKIRNEVNKMRLNDDRDLTILEEQCNENNDKSQVTTSEIVRDIVICLKCIQGITRSKIVMDAMEAFQGVWGRSKRFEECKEDDMHQNLQSAIQTVINAFISGSIQENTRNNLGGIRIADIRVLQLRFDSPLQLSTLLNFWEEHQTIIGETKCKKEFLRWLKTIIANTAFVDELFEHFEKDEDFKRHLKLFQVFNPSKSQRLDQLKFIRKQLVTEIATNVSGGTMSEMMTYLLWSFSAKVSAQSISKLDSAIESWRHIGVLLTQRNAGLFISHFAPTDESTWDDSIKQMRKICELSAHQINEMNCSWYSPHCSFVEELLDVTSSDTFKHFWYDVLDESSNRWCDPEGILHHNLDAVDMCLWLESINWRPEQSQSIGTLRKIFLDGKVTGSIFNDAADSGNDHELTSFISKLKSASESEEDIALLFAELEKQGTFKWNRLYSMSILKVIYNERIKPSWKQLCDQVQEGVCRVYDIQKYFQLMPWHIDETQISDEVHKMIFIKDSQNMDLIRNRVWRATKDVVSCLQCIECLSMLRIIMDGVSLFQNILSGSKRYNGLKMDPKYQSLKRTLDLVQEFDFYRRYAPVLGNAESSALGATELLSLNSGSTMTMAYLLDFWNNHLESIGKIKSNHEGLKWLFTLCSHDIFVNELFAMFEDDDQCMDPFAFVSLSK